MHGFDYSIPRFLTSVRGIRIELTPKLIFEVLHILRVSHLDYPSFLKMNLCLSLWNTFILGEHQNTPCSGFVKGPRFLNMVTTFVLHPLSLYNSITEPRAQFLLSLLKGLTIEFPSHFILSLIDVYKDMMTSDKFIFPSAITRIIRHVFVSYPESTHFSIMGAISNASIRRSEAQL